MRCSKCNQEKPNGVVFENNFYCNELCYKANELGLPKYVNLGHSALVLRDICDELVYYRVAGCWEVDWQEIDGVLYSKSTIDHLNKIPLVEITEEEWREDNKGYL